MTGQSKDMLRDFWSLASRTGGAVAVNATIIPFGIAALRFPIWSYSFLKTEPLQRYWPLKTSHKSYQISKYIWLRPAKTSLVSSSKEAPDMAHHFTKTKHLIFLANQHLQTKSLHSIFYCRSCRYTWTSVKTKMAKEKTSAEGRVA